MESKDTGTLAREPSQDVGTVSQRKLFERLRMCQEHTGCA
jgi:hypothetical protein